MALLISPAATTQLLEIQRLERASLQRFASVIDAIAADAPSPLRLLSKRQAAGLLLVV